MCGACELKVSYLFMNLVFKMWLCVAHVRVSSFSKLMLFLDE